MGKPKILVSITADTSMMESKISALLEVLPEHIPDELLCMVTGLVSDVVFVNRPPAVGAGGAFDVTYTLDFARAAYSEVLAAARAFKFNLAHE